MIEKGKAAHDAFYRSALHGQSNWNDLEVWQRDAWAECESAIRKDSLTCSTCHVLTVERCSHCGEDMY